MIVTTLSGGIGNQLFMYATARALALRTKTGLIINNTTDFKKDAVYHRSYELKAFNVAFEKDSILSFDYLGGDVIKKISKKLGRNLLCPSYKYFYDVYNNHEFNPDVLKVTSPNVYIEGYWHSELYFSDFEKEIREDLTFNFEKSEQLKQEENSIFGSDEITPVCIGVRRYEEAPNAERFNLTEEEYYLNAMKYIAERVHNPVFYVFTQAKQWVRNKLMTSKYNIKFIADKEENGTVEDLYLMSKFKYHIISNSSYYWWGAWLAKGNIVVSCQNWYNPKANCYSWVVL